MLKAEDGTGLGGQDKIDIEMGIRRGVVASHPGPSFGIHVLVRTACFRREALRHLRPWHA